MTMSLSSGLGIYHFVSSLIFSVLLFLDRGIIAINFPTSYTHEQLDDNDTGMLLRDNSLKPPPAPQERIHPGVIASVVVVSLIAIVAAVFIIRKYCFHHSEATYRYSVLRGMEEDGTAEDLDSDADLGPSIEDSDEDILE